jgi:hypothetical protein
LKAPTTATWLLHVKVVDCRPLHTLQTTLGQMCVKPREEAVRWHFPGAWNPHLTVAFLKSSLATEAAIRKKV